MCDYSLESAARRDAVAGDQLKTARIGVHATVGLIAREDPSMAVCLKPGTKLIVSAIPADLQLRWGVGDVTTATFAKSSQTQGLLGFFRHSYYHDGVIFDGAIRPFALFQEFPLGVEVSVEVIPGETCDETADGEAATRAAPELVSA
ncbi:MAG TPA: hypothetical protein VH189_15980 [Rhizomicrobium sp.]|nr:hypothetical protein [Rhizomicrobium sp.]